MKNMSKTKITLAAVENSVRAGSSEFSTNYLKPVDQPSAALLPTAEEKADPGSELELRKDLLAGQVSNDQSEPPTPPVDPPEMAAFAIPENAQPLQGIRKVVSVAIGKPKQDEWLRILALADSRNQFYLLRDTRLGGIKSKSNAFVVPPKLAEQIPNLVESVRFYPCITRLGALHLIDVKMRTANGDQPRTLAPMINALQLGAEQWVQIVWDDQQSSHVVSVAPGKLPEPEWPDDLKTLWDWVKMAYGSDRLVKSLEDEKVRAVIDYRRGLK
jgi:hypothetical protein